MIEKNEAIRSLIKMAGPTMRAAGLHAQGTDVPGEKERNYISVAEGVSAVNYEGETGTARVEFIDNLMKVLVAKPDDKEFKEVSVSLFENEEESFGQNDLRSAGNEIIDSIARAFNITPIYDADKTVKGKAQNKANVDNAEKKPARKKRVRRSDAEFDNLDLAYRLESVYTDERGKADEMLDKYDDMFLAEEYMQNVMVDHVMDSIKSGDRATLKRIFKTFNLFYDQGEKDTQSMIAVSLLGVPLAQQDDSVLESLEGWMSETLAPAVNNVVKYYKKGNTQRKLNKYYNPKPYKPSAKERRQQAALDSLKGAK